MANLALFLTTIQSSSQCHDTHKSILAFLMNTCEILHIIHAMRPVNGYMLVTLDGYMLDTLDHVLLLLWNISLC